MAITFPRGDILDLLKVRRAFFYLARNQELSTLGSGDTVGKDLAPSLWRCKFQTTPMTHAEALAAQSALNSLDGVINTFTAWPVMMPYPSYDPDGTILGANTVQIAAVASAKALSLKGLPAGYALAIGEFVSIAHSGGTGFYQVVEAALANGSGVTGTFEVRPFLHVSKAVNDVVTLKKPRCKMRMLSAGEDYSNESRFKSAVAFEAQQVY